MAIALLQRECAVTLVTQNVDDLHERAGSGNVIHMHGELLKARCERCGTVVDWSGDMDSSSRCSHCGRNGGLRPHIVWFGEMPLEMESIDAAIASAGIFVAIGTSGNVYPAAGFASIAVAHGIRTLEINPAETGISRVFDEHRRGPAGQVVPAWVEEILAV
ncbi:MAG: Sir2 family NAD-dependent protein deacetylase [Verrucomicrobiota bacterium]